MLKKYHGSNAACFVINIDSCENDVLSGRFCCVESEKSFYFSCLSQLILNIDKFIDDLEGPQSFQQVRTMSPVYLLRHDTAEGVHPQRGNIATFVLNVAFRYGVSWQGSVSWLEKKVDQNFRSVLELLTLINSAVSEKQQELWESRKVAKAE